MIPKKPAPASIRGGYRFSEKIMLNNKLKAKRRLNPSAISFQNMIAARGWSGEPARERARAQQES